MGYEEMLEEGYKNVPKIEQSKARFEIPKVKGHIHGNTTIISNFYQIAQTFNRKPEHLLKYLLKELATPGELKKNGIIIGSKISASTINEKIRKYAIAFVLCPECSKPDTKLIKEGDYLFIRCMACGAKHSVKKG